MNRELVLGGRVGDLGIVGSSAFEWSLGGLDNDREYGYQDWRPMGRPPDEIEVGTAHVWKGVRYYREVVMLREVVANWGTTQDFRWGLSKY